MTQIDRRSFLRYSGIATGGALAGPAFVHTLRAVAAAEPSRRPGGGASVYGPLQPVAASNEPAGFPYLALPAGFSYVVFGRTGEPMSDGTPHAVAHDGMAAFGLPDGRVRLTRNQEDRNGPGAGSVAGPVETRYDALGGGGVTVLDFDPATRALAGSFIGLNGTIVNCAGGVAYRSSGWLTCEESVAGPPEGFTEKHGYVFLLPADATTTVPAEPLTSMGRFTHEAVAVSRRSGIVYLTEDAGSGRGSGLYRFLPSDIEDLSAGGRLQMLAVRGRRQADLREGQRLHRPLAVRWVDIDDPDPDPVVEVEEPGATSVFAQGYVGGGALFNRLEGIWPAQRGIFFASTSGGDVKNGDVNDDGFAEGFGQIWQLLPCPRGDELQLVFESPGGTVLDSPDNLTVSHHGGIVLCEDDASSADGDGHPLAPGSAAVNRLIGLDPDGSTFEFAVNRYNDTEWAGACYSPNGEILFANIYGNNEPGSGFTVAITGPWDRGSL